ncbi:MAG: aspartate aminotransferase family protein [Pirellulaceae bacterium]|nr:aspartate aminotransferase family protein [Pirellulaceae bacterium]
MDSADFIHRDRKNLLHPLHHPSLVETPHVWVRGEGPYLFDADGKRFLDGASGLWNVVAGHGRQELIHAANQQAQELAFCSGFAGHTNPRAIELAERLGEITYPSIEQFFFTSGGAEATESSIKTARYYWKLQGKPQKNKTISLTWGYHGLTLAAMSATGMESYWTAFEPRVPGFVQIPSHYPYRYETPAGEDPGTAAANELERAILQEGPDTVAMFLAEPVTGAGGIIVPPDTYFPRIREICNQYDVLFVADEIITGFGRTGQMFGLQHWGVEPDILQFAKAITSGYFPLGGIGINQRISETIRNADSPYQHAYTYNGHPIGCAVALANLDLIEKEGFVQQAKQKGQYLLSALQAAFEDHPHVGDIRGKGLMCGVEFVLRRDTKQVFPPSDKIGLRIHSETQKRGLVTRVRGDVFCLAPPIITETKDLDWAVAVLVESVRQVL